MIARRLAQAPLILLAVYTVTLSLAWLVPGNPVEGPEGRRPPPEVIEQLESRYDLSSFGGFYVGYLERASGVRWLRDRLWGERANGGAGAGAGADVVGGGPVFDLGPSLRYRDWTVNEIIAGSLPASVVLGASAMGLAVVIGVGAGVIGGCRPGGWADGAASGLSLVGVSVPGFVVGSLLLAGFGVLIPVFPVGGWGTLGGLVLPALTLSLPFAAYIARLTRVGMISALRSEYVRTARAKGLGRWRVVMGHALPNALLPVVSFLGPGAAGAMTGSFVVERVFRVPGIGQHFVNAVQNKDLFLIIGVTLVYATMLVVFNLVVDVLYRWVDPRTAG